MNGGFHGSLQVLAQGVLLDRWDTKRDEFNPSWTNVVLELRVDNTEYDMPKLLGTLSAVLNMPPEQPPRMLVPDPPPGDVRDVQDELYEMIERRFDEVDQALRLLVDP